MPSAREGPSRPSPLGISERETSIPFAALGSIYLAHARPRPSSRFAAPPLCCGPPDSPPFCKSSFASIECPRFARSAFTSRTVTRGRQPAGAGPLLRAGPLGDCRGRPCGKCPCGPAGRLARNLLQPSVTPARRSVVAEKPWNHHVHVPDRSLKDPPTHLVVPTRCGSKQTPSRSIAQATLSRRSATERRARACPWPRARSA